MTDEKNEEKKDKLNSGFTYYKSTKYDCQCGVCGRNMYAGYGIWYNKEDGRKTLCRGCGDKYGFSIEAQIEAYKASLPPKEKVGE